MRTCALLVVLGAAFGCTRAPAKAPAPPDGRKTDREPTPAAVLDEDAASSGVEPGTTPAEPPALSIERWHIGGAEDERSSSTTPAPAVEIRFPFAGQVIRKRPPENYVVRLSLERAGADHEVELALDGRRPRAVPPGKTRKLGELVAANETLEPGLHVLTATLKVPVSAPQVSGQKALVRPSSASSDAPFAVVPFWIGQRGENAPELDAPLLFCGAPFGTFNGSRAADAVPLDFMVVGAELGERDYRLELSVSGPRSARTTLLDDAPRLLRDLPSGDYRIELELTDAAGQKLPGLHRACHQTITVNREAPERIEP